VNDDEAELLNFGGVARLFPLPSLVLFPHTVQPLHIFEPRYRDMTADALADDRLIAMVLHQPGWEKDYDGRPNIHEVACLGRVIADQRLPDGRYNLLLQGIARVRILAERADDKRYRTAEVELMPDSAPPKDEAALRSRLAELVLARFGTGEQERRHLETMFASDLSLGAMCDVLGFALPLTLDHKQALLKVSSVAARVASLIGTFAPPATPRFPPEFSAN